MKNFLNLDSPFMIFLSNLTDIVVLNVLCLICCIPIVTIGPSVTAMHYVTLKIVREEEGHAIKSFFKAFRENFKKSFIIWMIFLVITAVFLVDYRILVTVGIEENKIIASIIGVIYLFVCFTMMYTFPLLSRFENTIKQTVKNAFLMSLLHIFKTVIMAVIYVVPFVFLPKHHYVVMVFLLLGMSGPAYVNSHIWKSIFKKYEPQEEVEERIVPDEEFQIPEE